MVNIETALNVSGSMTDSHDLLLFVENKNSTSNFPLDGLNDMG